jgi:hypothetical protein
MSEDFKAPEVLKDRTDEPDRPQKQIENFNTFELFRDYTPPEWGAEPFKNYL